MAFHCFASARRYLTALPPPGFAPTITSSYTTTTGRLFGVQDRAATWSPAFGSLTDGYLRELLEARLSGKCLCWAEVTEQVTTLWLEEDGSREVPSETQVRNWFRRQTRRHRQRRCGFKCVACRQHGEGCCVVRVTHERSFGWRSSLVGWWWLQYVAKHVHGTSVRVN